MSDPPPKLSSNLIVSRQQMPEGSLYIIKNPITGRFFKFQEPQYLILQLLNGKNNFSTIQNRIKEEYQSDLTQEDFDQFVTLLKQLGIVDTSNGDDQPQSKPESRRIRGNLLYQRFKAFDPDTLFNHLIGKVSFCFTPYFVAVTAFSIILAFLITLTNWQNIRHDTLNLLHFEGLALAYVTLIVITTLHEFAHGLTCKHFGGEVHEMGFMLIYFQPAFYCNVSDAWLFPEKSQRLWVTFAGAYFEISLWALATILWRVTEPFTTINQLALIVMASSGIKTLFNLNPLIKLDGYYLLSDYLELPNLRERAFSYLGSRLRWIWSLGASEKKEVPSRERHTYLTYGLLAGVFSILFLGYILSWLGGMLIAKFQGFGFIIIMGVTAMVFRNPLKALFKHLGTLFRPEKDSSLSFGKVLKLFIIGGGLFALLFLFERELTVTGEFTALPIHNSDIRAKVDGIIEEVYVKEGDQVQSGDLIARLSDREYRAELDAIKARILEKEARLKMYKAGPRQEEIALARKSVNTANTRLLQAQKRNEEMHKLLDKRLIRIKVSVRTARERYRYAQRNLERVKELWGKKHISRREYERIEEQTLLRKQELHEAEALLSELLADGLGEYEKAVVVASKELEEAESKLSVLLAGTRAEEIEATEAEILSLQARQQYLEGQLSRVIVTSPHEGVITTPKIQQKVGLLVESGDLIAKVHKQQIITAEIAVSELEIAEVYLGQPVIFKARAYPTRNFYGSVVSIAPAAVEDEQYAAGARIIRVTSKIANSGLLLKSEMTGNAKILCGKRRFFDIITRRLVRHIRVEFWSWW